MELIPIWKYGLNKEGSGHGERLILFHNLEVKPLAILFTILAHLLHENEIFN